MKIAMSKDAAFSLNCGYTHFFVAIIYFQPVLNTGADINNFMPVTFEELVANNERFKNEN